MIPNGLREFFGASAGVAGAVIGLLFVAISVAGDRRAATTETHVNRIRAHAALSTFLNSLVVSLFALVATKWLGGAATVCPIIGLTFVGGSLLSLRRLRRTWRDLRDAAFLLALMAVLVGELIAGLSIDIDPRDTSAVQTIAVMVVSSFVIGIDRSWELIGAPASIGLGHETTLLVRRAAHHVRDVDNALESLETDRGPPGHDDPT